ncbi:hypothetical protein B0I73DRAFT_23358 [Yarrowia lipolytica]|uniref:BTB domain-containing protein n=1 Tax=Yarrowia lipolytica TaxID=4952 RepID=A0A371C2R4_YARLL|nr:hypothetical protein B0I71DRAFT_2899 [Yarrowia lipolytica]RDW40473.1 hypothetical protein B0I73DRAFT_23358 [Yarrowia lipolytica]RDW47690.1 hypothetical protein B0I74DRAFT_12537 [Yarrowia lipolytica]RDW53910.1 hypothetical protein B0I75DRAFT_17945 [Yarrowia lipolytica]
MARRKSTRKKSPNSLKSLSLGGDETPATREQFDQDIEGNVYAQCELQNVGIFYFVFGDPVEGDREERSDIWLKFYNNKENVVHSSAHSIMMASRDSTDTCFAIDQDTFLFSGFLLTLDNAWSTVDFRKFDSHIESGMADFLTGQTSIHKTGLSRIRQDSEPDFTLICEDGDKIEVHRSVMEGLWPFFKGMMVSKNMREIEQKRRVKLSMPKTTLEALVRYLYGEVLDLTLMDAANLILYAQRYELPELVQLATTWLKREQEHVDIEQAIYLWRKSLEAENDHVRDFASKKIEQMMPEVEDFDDQIQHLKKNELISLFSDVSVAMSRKRRKVE